MTRQHTLATILMILTSAVSAGCQTPPPLPDSAAVQPVVTPKHYVCPRTPNPILIDGRLDDDAWQRAPWTDAFVDIEGDAKPVPRFHTRAKMLWDDTYFYIAAEMEEPHVWGKLTEHDQIVYHDNDFEIFIDPNGDRSEYYEIEINVLGTIFDLFLAESYNNGGPALHGWDATGMISAIAIDGTLNDPSDIDRGWSVEFALPWSLLAPFAQTPAPPQDGDVWRVNFSRVQWQHELLNGAYRKVPKTAENNWVWSPQGVINMHVPEHWGEVKFVIGSSVEGGAEFSD